MTGAIAMILALILFVVVHEAGHFFAAKWSQMKVTEFFVGFGPRLWSTMRGETEYGFKAIPAGGYVRIAGMNPFEDVPPEDEGRTYRDKSTSSKLFVVLAGIFLNFLVAYLILWGLFGYYGEPDGQPIPEVAQVVDDSAAEAAGMQEGDVLLAIAGDPIDGWDDASDTIAGLAGETVEIIVLRDGSEVALEATIGTTQNEAGETVGFLGFAPTIELTVTEVGFFAAAGLAGEEVWFLTKQSYRFIIDLVTPSTIGELVGGIGGGEVATDARPVSIVGLAQIGAQAEQLGWANILFFMASINVILGALNLLPILPLDGGHAAIAIYEKVFRRKANLQALAPVAVAVVALFAFIGVVSILLDLTNPIDLGG